MPLSSWPSAWLQRPPSPSNRITLNCSPTRSKTTLWCSVFITPIRKLSFDSNAQPTSPATPGFGPSEGRIYVGRIQLAPGKLTIDGKRPIDIFDRKSGRWLSTDLGSPVSIEVHLPAGELASTSVAPLLQRIFLSAAEVSTLRCSPDESRALGDGTLQHAEKDVPAVTSVDELTSFVCQAGIVPTEWLQGSRLHALSRHLTPNTHDLLPLLGLRARLRFCRSSRPPALLPP